MKSLPRKTALAVSTLFATGLFPLHAEDIDLYVSGSPIQNAPNVLMVLDNTSNWASAGWRKYTQGQTIGAMEECSTDINKVLCEKYVEQIFGNNTTLTQGQVEAAVIRLVFNELVCAPLVDAKVIDVNVGLEFMAPTKGANGDSKIAAAYIRRPVLPLKTGDGGTCQQLIGDLTEIYDNINAPAFKAASSASYGELLFEAFKYFGGYTNPKNAINDSPTVPNDGEVNPPGDTRTAFGPQRYTDHTLYSQPGVFVGDDKAGGIYKSPINADNNCGKNYIILIGNNLPNSDKNNKFLLDNLQYPVVRKDLCLPGSSEESDVLADVWARLLSTTDVNSVASQQPVYSYAVNVYAPGTSQKPQAFQDQRKILQCIAGEGGTGAAGYYEVNGNLRKMVEALKDIFLTIAAKNSVFASSSLPVSVNTQGTYLNQVFMGMFRPDADAYQRWNGNLKQYKINQNSSGNLYLADATNFVAETDKNGVTVQTGMPVIDSGTSGFVRECAASFWTSDTSNFPVAGTAYWQRVPDTKTPQSGCETPPSDGTSTTFSLESDWPDGRTVEKGGAGQWVRKQTCGPSRTPTWCGRLIKTCASVSACDSNANVTDFVSGGSGVPTSTLSDDLLKWVAGGNLGDGPPGAPISPATIGNYEFYNGTTQSAPTDGLTGGLTYVRPTVHGDVVHSRPLAINYGVGSTNDVVVYYGSGDGMLRAIDANRPPSPKATTAGQELWAFIAPEFFSKFNRLKENSPKIAYPNVSGPPTPTPKDYFFDGAIGAYQARGTDGAITAVWLYPSMRRGGRMIYAFDATKRPMADNSSSSPTEPQLKWRFGCPNANNDTGCVGGTVAANIGQTWSTPRVIRLKGSTASDTKTYVAFGGGYDTCEDENDQFFGAAKCSTSTKGQGIFVINANDGHSGTNGSVDYIDLTAKFAGAGRVIADLVPVDVNADGYTDVIYAADTRGNLWRINTSSGSDYVGIAPSSWKDNTHRIASFSDWTVAVDSSGDPDLVKTGMQARKFMYAPDVVTLGSVNIVLIGTGDREHPIAVATGSPLTVDTTKPQAAKVKNRFYGIYDDSQVTPTQAIDGRDRTGAACTNGASNQSCDLVDVTTTGVDYSAAIALSKGWYINLSTYSNNSTTQEQVVTTPTTFGGVTYFSTFQPTNPATAAQQCSNLGTARGYTVNFLTGDLRKGDTSRYSEFSGGGFAPSPVSGVVQLDNGKLVPFILGGKGTSPLEAGKPPLNVPGVRKQVYRFKKVDAK